MKKLIALALFAAAGLAPISASAWWGFGGWGRGYWGGYSANGCCGGCYQSCCGCYY